MDAICAPTRKRSVAKMESSFKDDAYTPEKDYIGNDADIRFLGFWVSTWLGLFPSDVTRMVLDFVFDKRKNGRSIVLKIISSADYRSHEYCECARAGDYGDGIVNFCLCNSIIIRRDACKLAHLHYFDTIWAYVAEKHDSQMQMVLIQGDRPIDSMGSRILFHSHLEASFHRLLGCEEYRWQRLKQASELQYNVSVYKRLRRDQDEELFVFPHHYTELYKDYDDLNAVVLEVSEAVILCSNACTSWLYCLSYGGPSSFDAIKLLFSVVPYDLRGVTELKPTSWRPAPKLKVPQE